MRLNLDCMYDTMTVLEDALTIKSVMGSFFFESISMGQLISIMREKKNQYSDIEVAYAAVQLVESGYIATTKQGVLGKGTGEISIGKILYITPKGHEFMENRAQRRTSH